MFLMSSCALCSPNLFLVSYTTIHHATILAGFMNLRLTMFHWPLLGAWDDRINNGLTARREQFDVRRS